MCPESSPHAPRSPPGPGGPDPHGAVRAPRTALDAPRLLGSPDESFAAAARAPARPLRLLAEYAAPLVLVPPAARLLGLAAFGARDALGGYRLTTAALGLDFGLGVLLLALALLAFVVLARGAAALLRAPLSWPRAWQFAVLASTAGWISGAFDAAAPLRPLGFLARLYGVVLVYRGARRLVGLEVRPALAFSGLVLVGEAVAGALLAGAARLLLASL